MTGHAPRSLAVQGSLLALVSAMTLAACSSGHGTYVSDAGTPQVIASTSVQAPDDLGDLWISPDGRRVAGIDYSSLAAPVCVADIDGTHEVCGGPMVGVSDDQLRLAWSPDSTRIAFTEAWDTGGISYEPDVWVMDATTGQATDLTDDGVAADNFAQTIPKAQYDIYPSWSPDGRSIRFARQSGTTTGTTIMIESVPAAGGPVTQLGTISGQLINLAGLAFSRDGTTIAWSIARGGTNAGKAGTTAGKAGTPAVTNTDWDYSPATATSTVHIRSLSGGTDHALSNAPVTGDQSLLSFSADGQYLLVDNIANYPKVSSVNIHSTARVYPVGGGAGWQISPDALYATWSPTGHALAFATFSQAGSTLRVAAEPRATPSPLALGGVSSERPIAPAPVGKANLQWITAGLFVNVPFVGVTTELPVLAGQHLHHVQQAELLRLS